MGTARSRVHPRRSFGTHRKSKDASREDATAGVRSVWIGPAAVAWRRKPENVQFSWLHAYLREDEEQRTVHGCCGSRSAKGCKRNWKEAKTELQRRMHEPHPRSRQVVPRVGPSAFSYSVGIRALTRLIPGPQFPLSTLRRHPPVNFAKPGSRLGGFGFGVINDGVVASGVSLASRAGQREKELTGRFFSGVGDSGACQPASEDAESWHEGAARLSVESSTGIENSGRAETALRCASEVAETEHGFA